MFKRNTSRNELDVNKDEGVYKLEHFFITIGEPREEAWDSYCCVCESNTYIYTHIHTYIHTYTHMHINTHT